MATLTFEDKTKNGLIKKFQTLLGRARVDNNGKEAMLWSYGVESACDLNVAQLIEACNALDMQLNPALAEMDKLRKRLIAAISDYLRVMGVDIFQKEFKECTYDEKEQRRQYAKGTAINASGKEDFNQIPRNQLISLYHGFVKMKKDMAAVEELTREILLTN
jgi:hypothetical protein